MDSVEINIMTAAEARATAEARRVTKVQQEVNEMIDAIKNAVAEGRNFVWLYSHNYSGKAFEVLVPVLREKGYCVEDCVEYVEVCW